MQGIYASSGVKGIENNLIEWKSIKKCFKIHIEIGK